MFKCCVRDGTRKKSKREKKRKSEEAESRGVSSPERRNGEAKNGQAGESIVDSPRTSCKIKDETEQREEEKCCAGQSPSSSSPSAESPGRRTPRAKSERRAAEALYAPAYIERTIVDGPDEDGDDSVFEASTNEPDRSNGGTPPASAARALPGWLSREAAATVTAEYEVEEDEGERRDLVKPSEDRDGTREPPATPVARDELALRRHRFFSDLLEAARDTSEHRVRFDPLGPVVHPGCESEDREQRLEDLVTRLEDVTRRLESVPDKLGARTRETAVQTRGPTSPGRTDRSNGEDSSGVMSVSTYEDLVAGPVDEYLRLSAKIGGDVAAHSKLVAKAFQIQSQFIRMASARPAPTNQSEQVSLLGPTSTTIQEIQEYREKNRGSAFFNHLSAVSESIPALGWVAMVPTPAPYIKEMNDAGQFYTNRVLKDWKEKDKTHAEWCRAWVQTLSELQQYVRKNHTTGLVWGKAGAAPVPPPPGGMPPPPPPPAMSPIGEPAIGSNDDRSALFAQINQGENITRSLKKVTADMQTHKNSSLRTGPAPFKAPVTGNAAAFPSKTVPPANAPIDKPPVFARDGKKWIVEYHKGNKDLVVENAEMNNVVYMFRCQDSSIAIKGKINSIVIDSCRKSTVVFDSLVSSIEFVNCQSVQMQVLGKVPTISIDKTDGCQMYLSPESLDVALISSKSSEMNIMVPRANGDYAEYPVPEQFKTTIGPRGLVTAAVDSLG